MNKSILLLLLLTKVHANSAENQGKKNLDPALPIVASARRQTTLLNNDKG